MAVCLEYQAVYMRRSSSVFSWRAYAAIYLMLLVVVGIEVRNRLLITSLGYSLHQEQQMGLDLDKEIRDVEAQLTALTTYQSLRTEGQKRLDLQEVSAEQMRVAKGSF